MESGCTEQHPFPDRHTDALEVPNDFQQRNPNLVHSQANRLEVQRRYRLLVLDAEPRALSKRESRDQRVIYVKALGQRLAHSERMLSPPMTPPR